MAQDFKLVHRGTPAGNAPTTFCLINKVTGRVTGVQQAGVGGAVPPDNAAVKFRRVPTFMFAMMFREGNKVYSAVSTSAELTITVEDDLSPPPISQPS